jgi:inorganic pyrophosphatase
MNLFHSIKASENFPNEINVVIENCKGGSNKIEYNKDEGVFKLDGVLYSAVFWPFDYGFIPQTWHEDEDPIDVIILTTYLTFPGCLIKASMLSSFATFKLLKSLIKLFIKSY